MKWNIILINNYNKIINDINILSNYICKLSLYYLKYILKIKLNNIYIK